MVIMALANMGWSGWEIGFIIISFGVFVLLFCIGMAFVYSAPLMFLKKFQRE